MISSPHAGDRSFYTEQLAAARSRLDEKTWKVLWSEGRAVTTEEAVARALGDSPGG